MARALWKGTISFGLVSINVGLVTMTEEQSFDLDMIDARDNSRIKYKKVNAKTGREVPHKEIVKGFEFKKGQYVIIEAEDFKKANPRATQTIDIESFVDVSEVNPAYFEKPYMLEPLKGGEKAYALLRETLKKTGKIGIGKVVIRTKQYLSAVMVQDDLLILELLRFPHEIRTAKDLGIQGPKAKVSAQEIKMAEELVASMEAKFQPSKFKDTYYDDLKKLIQRKVKRGDTEEVEEEETPTEETSSGRVLDLMPLLQQSLKKKKPSARAGKKKTAKKAVKRGA